MSVIENQKLIQELTNEKMFGWNYISFGEPIGYLVEMFTKFISLPELDEFIRNINDGGNPILWNDETFYLRDDLALAFSEFLGNEVYVRVMELVLIEMEID